MQCYTTSSKCINRIKNKQTFRKGAKVNMKVILMSHLMNQTTDTAVITHIPEATRERETRKLSSGHLWQYPAF